jgi:hypothetical protein
MPACRSRTVPALPRKPRPLVTPHRNSRVCRNEAERAQTVWRSSCRGVYEAVTLPAGICRAPRYRLLIGVPRRVSRAVFEPSLTARRRLLRSSEFVPSACLYSIAGPSDGQDHSAYIRDHGCPRRRPSAFQAGHIPSWLESCECYALLAVTAACRWSLLLLSPVATGRAASDGSYPSSEALDDGYLSLPAACSLSARAASSPRPWSLCAAPPPIGLTAADLFAGGEVSRADSRVR